MSTIEDLTNEVKGWQRRIAAAAGNGASWSALAQDVRSLAFAEGMLAAHTHIGAAREKAKDFDLMTMIARASVDDPHYTYDNRTGDTYRRYNDGFKYELSLQLDEELERRHNVEKFGAEVPTPK